MSGHSKWATIKRKKGKLDAERGRVFTQHIKEITIAAREGGGDPEGNPRLRTAIASAKGSNMPNDNIKRAILKGTGDLPGVIYESIVYEGYGPGGVALYMEIMTDNRNRTVSEIRHYLTKYGGNLGANGCVAWKFHKKGIITVELDAADEDTLLEIAMDLGAEDMTSEDGVYEIFTPAEEIDNIRQGLEDKGIPMVNAIVTMQPESTLKIEKENEASSLMKLYELLEEHEDIQKVYSDFDIDESLLEKLA